MSDLREKIQVALNGFQQKPLKESALDLLAVLGYKSDRTLNLGSNKPKAFVDFLNANSGDIQINESKAMVSDWKSADLLFQLTDNELSGQRALFDEHEVSPSLLKSYVFFAIELTGDNYARGKLTDIARQINRVFPMPVMVLMKHKANKSPVLSIAVINRRANKRDGSKDVLGKVTIIRDVAFSDTHRGHLDILDSFAIENLSHPQRLPINNFDNLHTAWEEVFNVELLNKRFYKELANWYFWAIPQVEFPTDVQGDDEKRRATSLIRLLTRLIFCWFLKEKGLVPESLFNETDLKSILKEFKSDSSNYYHAILQNLFFGTLNQRMGKDSKGNPYRAFAKDEGFHKNKNTYGVDNLFRYEECFKDPDSALALFADIPFLNGGLFECLDCTDPKTDKKIYIDGFSRNKKKRPVVPNCLFFAAHQDGIDLSAAYGERSRRNETVRGLIRILNAYKFTIVENTPIDQEIALDPELLGKVFENLLASYNEETKTTARKQTGSFYTPRPIVEYMVDESLKAYLTTTLTESGVAEDSAKAGLDILFAYTEQQHPFTQKQVDKLLEAIHACKILDPACGSGAFPMGMLQKLVYIIHKLDPTNEKWMQIQIDKASEIPDSSARDAAIKAIEQDFKDNEDDYGRKLYLIENCLYGVDIQPIAIQISKLRFFISLVCDQKTNRSKKDNLGIRPLPNLETKFVAADTLIGLKKDAQLELFENAKVKRLESELQRVRHDHFAATTRQRKLTLQNRDRELRDELAKELRQEAFWDQSIARKLADWDPYDPQSRADYFEPLWMFDRSLESKFQIVIGNPPYLFISNLPRDVRERYAAQYSTAEYRFDLYGFFIEKAVRDLLSQGGNVSFIVPHTLLSNDSFEKLRKLLLNESTILQVVDIGPSVFAGASNETMTFLAERRKPQQGHKIWVSNSTSDTFPAGSLEFHVSQDDWRRTEKSSWTVRVTSGASSILDLLRVGSVSLGELCTINQGLRTGDNATYISNEQNGPKWRPVVGGKDVGYYALLEPKQFVNYDRSKLDAPRKESIFVSKEKIIVQEIRNISLPRRIVATLDRNQVFALQSTNVINKRSGINKLFTIEYLLAVLNSSLANFYFRQCFPGNNHIASNQLASIPVRVPSQVQSAACTSLVSLIYLAHSSGTESIGKFLIDLLDACIMECYFREHMAERDLLFLDALDSYLTKYDPKASDQKQTEFIEHFYDTFNAPESPIRNRLLRLTADSPDLLAVIKAEGKV